MCEQATHSGTPPGCWSSPPLPLVVAAIGIHPESLLPAADGGEDGPAPTVSVYGGDWAVKCALPPATRTPRWWPCGRMRAGLPLARAQDAQLALFEAEIRLALELDKPIIVQRPAGPTRDVYALLKSTAQGHRALLFRQCG